MIFVGCLSIASGVVVAALHHQDKSRPVPPWLLKMTSLLSPPPGGRVPSSSSYSAPEAPSSRNGTPKRAKPSSAAVAPSESGTFHHHHTRSGNDNATSNGHAISTVAYQSRHVPGHSGAECDEEVTGRNLGGHGGGRYSPEWRRVASVIDGLSLAVGTTITVMAIVATVVLFLVTNANSVHAEDVE